MIDHGDDDDDGDLKLTRGGEFRECWNWMHVKANFIWFLLDYSDTSSFLRSNLVPFSKPTIVPRGYRDRRFKARLVKSQSIEIGIRKVGDFS